VAHSSLALCHGLGPRSMRISRGNYGRIRSATNVSGRCRAFKYRNAIKSCLRGAGFSRNIARLFRVRARARVTKLICGLWNIIRIPAARCRSNTPYFYPATSFSSVSVCNITLDSRQLFSKSDRGFGQIKSPYLQGPSRCTYRFVPDTGQRVELQIYRLVSIGRHNGTA